MNYPLPHLVPASHALYKKMSTIPVAAQDLSVCPESHMCALLLNVHCVPPGTEEVDQELCQSE